MKKNKGVTLVELVVSIVIFAIVIVGIAVFNSRNTSLAVKSERNAKRILLQERCIEEFKGRLKSSPVPGAQFDSIWNNSAVNSVLNADTMDNIPEIMTRLEVDSLLPDPSAALLQTGICLRVRVISIDTDLGVEDTTMILISRHD